MSVASILQTKGSFVYSVSSKSTVYEALLIMQQKNIGALVVIDEGKLVGIISERDYARKIILHGKSSTETLVGEIMTANPYTIVASDSIETCMELMSQRKIRHLPVMEGDEVAGMVSISDVVTRIIHSQRETIEHLHQYIRQ